MNFFEDQEIARKKTKKLVILFLSCVFATATILTFVLSFLLYLNMDGHYTQQNFPDFLQMLQIQYKLVLGAFSIISVTILGVTFSKIYSLGQGGESIAESLGAKRVKRRGSDPELKKYINIVEEMSIASGVPIPKIYIMENEPAINAFAAGFDINDCVICVTRGAIKYLTRDELQGVVAHEYSHIFNGDMKLNIKLIGYLHGLLALTQIGSFILRSSRYSRYSSRRDKNSGGIYILAIALYVVGGVGYFLGSLIRSSISKQREYLADASAVQYTRNPFGIGGALLKIHKLSEGSTVLAGRAEEVSHMFFSSVMQMNFATHPKLRERLEKIYPSMHWESIERIELKYPEASKKLSKEEQDRVNKEKVDQIFSDDAAKIASAGVILSSFSEGKKRIGEISKESVEKAQDLLAAIPFSLREKIQDPLMAKEVIMGFINETSQIKDMFRYPVFEVALGVLDELNKDEKRDFVSEVKKAVLQDQIISPSEFIHYYIIKNKLIPSNSFFEKQISKSDMKKAYLVIIEFAKLALDNQEHKFNAKEIGHSIKVLSASSMEIKKQVIDKIVEIVKDDELITPLEEEFVRLLCQSFRVPYPL